MRTDTTAGRSPEEISVLAPWGASVFFIGEWPSEKKKLGSEANQLGEEGAASLPLVSGLYIL